MYYVFVCVFLVGHGSEVAKPKAYGNTLTLIRKAPYIELHFTLKQYIKYPHLSRIYCRVLKKSRTVLFDLYLLYRA